MVYISVATDFEPIKYVDKLVLNVASMSSLDVTFFSELGVLVKFFAALAYPLMPVQFCMKHL